MVSVYELWASTENDREEINLAGVDVDWDMVFARKLPLDLVTTDGEQACDYFSLAGTLGVASAQLGKLLSSWATGRLRSIDVTVNRKPFVLLLPDQPADVLDLKLSEYTTFRSNPDRVKQVLSFAFHASRIPETPWVFTIRESWGLLLNGSAVAQLREPNFVGLKMVPLWNQK